MLFELNFIDCNLSVTLYCLLVGYDLPKKKKNLELLQMNALTCFAIPKSASFTRPLGSTRIFAPLTSLIKITH